MIFDIITIGDSVIDEFMEIDDATVNCEIDDKECKISFNYADKIPVKNFRKEVGGNAANISVNCATLGLKTAIYTEVGNDSDGNLILETLKQAGVDTSLSGQTEIPTDIHPVVVFKGERTIFSHHSKRDYRFPNFKSPRFIYYTSIGEGFEEIQNELEKWCEQNPNTILAMNPGSTQLHTNMKAVQNFLKNVDVLFVNKEEAQEIVGSKEKNVVELHKKLAEMGVGLSVITDSINGSSAYDSSKQVKIGIYDIDGTVKDKTGAGDAFASGFISAMFYGKEAEEALKWGAINSASGIAVVGATTGACTKEQMEEKLTKTLFTEPKL
ncbi:hypothetical protein A2886_01670 [candidate division WWE3 bacterium RIFCSPHIGHO2_01_FULL_42_13]|uniref:Carbohydrate kinase PfkB domain-containing protein n=1 Tax=candidate division WWE3 bacterium RIFCSPHIGHO2_01_FULL_42_13 TaxID=1802617 RepID=A0A1F4UR77_UNCKA|nr:MAG: hypothetical protein A2886_01670 [candidate division WWE3 bacterium RIFCSPHIGHO2_01_FULL_42_13]